MAAAATTTDIPGTTTDDSAEPRPSVPGRVLRGLVLLLVAWVVIELPTNMGPDFLDEVSKAPIYAMVGLSLNILIGYTGQLSLGHQGFVGVGAFAAAYSATEHGVPFALSVLIAVVFGAVGALLLGLVALRIRGLYLALITLVFGLTLEASLFQVDAITQGGAGQQVERPAFLAGESGDQRFYWFCLAILAGIVYIDWRLTRTKTGRALFALRENERVAAAFGINVTAFKLLAFVLSGAIAGLAGAMWSYDSSVANGADFNFFLALTFVLMTVVGGLNSRVGVIVGSTVFALLDYALEHIAFLRNLMHDIFGANAQFAPRLIGAVLLLSTLILNPGGIAQQIRPITRWLGGGPFTFRHDHDTGVGAVEGSSVRA